jgi:hypothetical protein
MRLGLLRPPVSAGRSAGLVSTCIFYLFALTPAFPWFATTLAATRIIPDDVAISAFAKPSGQQFQVLIRVPLIALNEIPFPVRANGYIDLSRAESMLPGVARYWVADGIDLYENGTRLPKPQIAEVRVAMPSDRSFASYQTALAHLTGQGSGDNVETYWNQAWLDVLLEYPIQSERSAFSLHPRFAHFGARVNTNLKFLASDGTVRPFEYQGDPEMIRLDPSGAEVGTQFFQWGFLGAIANTDYLLIVLCLILPLRQFRAAAPVAAAFICAGAVTLFSSAAGLATDGLWFSPLIQTLIAVSILIVAAQNIAGGVMPGRRALEALVFGLVFGFDFSFALAAKAQFGGTHDAVASAAFGAGTLLSLAIVFAALPPVLRLLFHFTRSERIETIVLSMLAAHASWHWMTERWDRLNRFTFRWPVLDSAFLATTMRWMMILVIFGGIVWFVGGWFTRPKGAAV